MKIAKVLIGYYQMFVLKDTASHMLKYGQQIFILTSLGISIILSADTFIIIFDAQGILFIIFVI